MDAQRFGLVLALLTFACGESGGSILDGGAADLGSTVDPDAGASLDAAPGDTGAEPEDARVDAGAPDAEESDLGLADAELPDAFELDGGFDGGPLDTGATADGGVATDGGSVPDPALPGPYLVATETLVAPNGNRDVPLDCRYPSNGPTAPLVLIGHGFTLPVSQYTSYAERLASHGYVACTADFQTSLIANHVTWASDLVASIDALLAASAGSAGALAGRIDSTRIVLSGHSLGGKLSFLAAANDPRVSAIVGLDPVDGAMFCNATRCPDASALLPFGIPIMVIGETLDQAGTPACAAAADNYQTFYDAAASPALEVTIGGAGHMSFLDDISSCGFACSACQMPTTANADVVELAQAYFVAFLGRRVLGITAYDDYLTGAIAQQRYVTTGRVTLRSR